MIKKETKSNFVLVRMEPSLYNQLYVLCSKEEITMAAYCRRALKNFIRKSKTK